MTYKNEFILGVCFIAACLFAIDLAYIKHLSQILMMNEQQFQLAGMMEYKNPTDGKTLYTPVYIKATK